MIITTYIVRFYLYKNEYPKRFVGVVEEVGVKGRRAFSSYEELWEILSSPTFPCSSPQGTKKDRKKPDKKEVIKSHKADNRSGDQEVRRENEPKNSLLNKKQKGGNDHGNKKNNKGSF